MATVLKGKTRMQPPSVQPSAKSSQSGSKKKPPAKYG